MSKIAALLFSLGFFFVNVHAQNFANIDTVNILGLQKTKYSYCAQFLDCLKPNASITEQAIQADVQRLWNLGLFSQVDYKILPKNLGEELVFVVKEKIYWQPILGFDITNDKFRLTLGALHHNLDGRGTYLKAAWSFYDRHSVELMVSNPQLFSQKWGAQVEAARWASLEPTQVYPTLEYKRANNFEVTKINVGGLVFFSPQFRQTLFFGGNFLHENYQEIMQAQQTEAPIELNAKKILLKSGVQLNNIQYYYHYRGGWQATSSAEVVYTFEQAVWFWKFANQLSFYGRVGKQHNWQVRAITGVSSNQVFNPFPAFVQDDFVNIRGVGNRIGRGSAELTLNTEWNSTVFMDKNKGAIVLAAFADASTLMPTGGKAADFFGKQLTHINVGGGLRLHVFRLYQGVLRVDYGVDVLNPQVNGLVLGFGHFF